MAEFNRLDDILRDVQRELLAAIDRYPQPLFSAHEGYAVILEELDELWDEIKAKLGQRNEARLRAEAIQVAAMAVRLVLDICDARKD